MGASRATLTEPLQEGNRETGGAVEGQRWQQEGERLRCHQTQEEEAEGSSRFGPARKQRGRFGGCIGGSGGFGHKDATEQGRGGENPASVPGSNYDRYGKRGGTRCSR